MNKSKLEQEMGIQFKDKKLLTQALTHSSYTREKNLSRAECNERLEFLGDAFFDAIIGEELYHRLPQKKEGFLTKSRALIVCEESLAEKAKTLSLGDYLQLGKGETVTGGREKASILADAMEAIIGAIYLDRGYEITKAFVLALFADRVQAVVCGQIHNDYKSAFQEKIQKKGPISIEYHLVSAKGPDHDKLFCVELRVNGEVYGSGSGKSKKEAEQNAAKEAMKGEA
ncbi:MAG: ribonuclease III [Anaerovoracaceae bacterium]